MICIVFTRVSSSYDLIFIWIASLKQKPGVSRECNWIMQLIKIVKFTIFLTDSPIFIEVFLVSESGLWKQLSFPVRILIRNQLGASWRSRGRNRIIQWYQDGQIHNFPDRLSDFSRSFPGLQIWFMETLWIELLFSVRILIRNQLGASWRSRGRNRIMKWYQEYQNCNFPDQFSNLSWNFPGLKIWFLETLWK